MNSSFQKLFTVLVLALAATAAFAGDPAGGSHGPGAITENMTRLQSIEALEFSVTEFADELAKAETRGEFLVMSMKTETCAAMLTGIVFSAAGVEATFLAEPGHRRTPAYIALASGILTAGFMLKALSDNTELKMTRVQAADLRDRLAAARRILAIEIKMLKDLGD